MPLKRQGTKIKAVHSPTRLCIEHRMIGILFTSVTFCEVTSCGSAARVGRRISEAADCIYIRVPTVRDAVEAGVGFCPARGSWPNVYLCFPIRLNSKYAAKA